MVGVDPVEDGCAAAVLGRDAQEAIATHAVAAAVRAWIIIRRVDAVICCRAAASIGRNR